MDIINNVDVVNELFAEEFGEMEKVITESSRTRPTIPPQPESVEDDRRTLEMFNKIMLFLGMMNFMEDNEDKKKRKPKVVRAEAWNFVMSWDDTLFQRQFRISKEDFFILCENARMCIQELWVYKLP